MSKWINIDDLPSGRVEWEDIFDAPSIDIVRCKECRYRQNPYAPEWCYEMSKETDADDFCSYGQKGDENVETD